MKRWRVVLIRKLRETHYVDADSADHAEDIALERRPVEDGIVVMDEFVQHTDVEEDDPNLEGE